MCGTPASGCHPYSEMNYKMIKKNKIIQILTIFAILITCLPVISQPGQQQLRYEVEVTVTQVDVIVTGKDGKRITGLKPENFKIYEDGKPQKLTNFFEVKGLEVYASTDTSTGASNAATAGGSGDKEAGEKDVNLKVREKPLPKEATSPISNKIIFYFDNLQLHPLNRNWSIKKLEKFINNNFGQGKTNQGMVVSLDDRLRIVRRFSQSPSILMEAVNQVKKISGAALMRVRRKEELKKEINRLVDETSTYDKYGQYESALDQARNYADMIQNDLDISLKALGALIDYMTGLRGRKILIYISDGLEIRPGEEVFSFLSQAFPMGNADNEAMNYDATRMFKELTSKCNANEISLYPVNARGLETAMLSADKHAGWNNRNRGAGVAQATSRVKNDAYNIMARDTGGLAITNTNNIESGLKLINQDLQYYYSLGYRSLYRGDNKYHSIKVKLAGVEGKYKIRVRSGHKHVGREQKIKASVMSGLFIKRYSNPLEIKARFLPVQPRALSNKMRLGFKIWIPLKNLVLHRRRVESVGKFKVYVVLKEADGSISPCNELVKEVKIPNKDLEVALKSNFPYEVEMYVDPGRYTISVAVRDMAGAAPTYFQLQRTVEKPR